jgi:hypothetical protein
MPAAISGNTPASARDGPPSAAVVDEKEPKAYHSAEMSGNKWSNTYGFVKHEGTAENGYDPIERNFESLVSVYGAGAAGGAAARGGAGGGPATKRSEKEEALLRDFEAYSAARDRDVAGPVQRR